MLHKSYSKDEARGRASAALRRLWPPRAAETTSTVPPCVHGRSLSVCRCARAHVLKLFLCFFKEMLTECGNRGLVKTQAQHSHVKQTLIRQEKKDFILNIHFQTVALKTGDRCGLIFL